MLRLRFVRNVGVRFCSLFETSASGALHLHVVWHLGVRFSPSCRSTCGHWVLAPCRSRWRRLRACSVGGEFVTVGIHCSGPTHRHGSPLLDGICGRWAGGVVYVSLSLLPIVVVAAATTTVIYYCRCCGLCCVRIVAGQCVWGRVYHLDRCCIVGALFNN